jgi:hypothetical protein
MKEAQCSDVRLGTQFVSTAVATHNKPESRYNELLSALSWDHIVAGSVRL